MKYLLLLFLLLTDVFFTVAQPDRRIAVPPPSVCPLPTTTILTICGRPMKRPTIQP
ncbi:hypothetical protein [Persicitalea sp.]|uniref:hypothetical protein n=1 Tax=Persicitalea sp. TaxID=3100273 RepID=UPI0035933A79